MKKIVLSCKVWQWDINDTVTIEGIENVSEWQIHFAATGDKTALVIEIQPDMTAYIPNQLVELGVVIYAYLYNVREERAYTETAILIPVSARPKPDDYISEPTDVLTWGQLRADIGTLSQLATENKANLVAAVNELHRDIDMVMTEQDEDIAAIQSDINEINQLIDYINDIDNEQSQAIVKIQSDTTSLKDKNQSQDEAISEIEQSITNINATDAAQSQAISSLSDSVDSAFAEVETALDGKQPIGTYVTSVNGTTPDKNGNINIDVQTYTAGDGISINEGAISVTNPMDDAQVSETTTWSSAKIISSISQPFSQSGSIITCYPVEGSPLHVVSDITAVQAGTGDPSPENVRPIVGWDSVSLWRGGKNLLNPANLIKRTTQTASYTNILTVKGQFVYKAGNSYTFSFNTENTGALGWQSSRFGCPINGVSKINFDGAKKIVGDYYEEDTYYDPVVSTKETPILVKTDNLYPSGDITNIQVELGSTATPYEPYRGQTYTADFGETVYGGTLDWATGVLTVTWIGYTFDGSDGESWVRLQHSSGRIYYSHPGLNAVISSTDYTKWICNNLVSYLYNYNNVSFPEYSIGFQSDRSTLAVVLTNNSALTVSEFKQWLQSNPVTIAYELQTPYTIQLTPAQVLAISGTNTVYCDTGDVTVTGYEDPRTTIANLSARIAALESAAAEI